MLVRLVFRVAKTVFDVNLNFLERPGAEQGIKKGGIFKKSLHGAEMLCGGFLGVASPIMCIFLYFQNCPEAEPGIKKGGDFQKVKISGI